MPGTPPPWRDPGQSGPEVYLNWDRAIDDKGYLRRCPVCGCRETFVRNDFPQITGFAIVVAAAATAVWCFAAGKIMEALAVLAGVALIDAVIYFFTGRCLVCYRCRTEFRRLPIARDHPAWDLSIGEKYRTVESPAGPDAAPPQPPAPPGDSPHE